MSMCSRNRSPPSSHTSASAGMNPVSYLWSWNCLLFFRFGYAYLGIDRESWASLHDIHMSEICLLQNVEASIYCQWSGNLSAFCKRDHPSWKGDLSFKTQAHHCGRGTSILIADLWWMAAQGTAAAWQLKCCPEGRGVQQAWGRRLWSICPTSDLTSPFWCCSEP